MHFFRRLNRNPTLLLFMAMAAVLALCLIALGGAHQGANSALFLGMPSLWFGGLIVLPFVLYALLRVVWKRFDRIAR